ncbi:MAG: hypothetical protein AW11_00895 [Candidatus Accumulibacter regalis]|uniref:Uncharacterized protein n=1 Tax=Accumulibacter regalis TaxID=522306 RepID=A0A011QLG0_ACCRE|nr:hypothetical protein [Accumulibacter sp.]EXI90192.1 MAG: hypothetical protein AW11_00895 [Candidatus Accumulibacter regalis]HRE72278.1 hypothetical protein [Accumulibacter sp.]
MALTEFWGWLDWVARGAGVVAVLLALVGFMFREKWKQVLQKSLASDLERLKAELARDNAEHAAKLLPQFEQVKHDFHQKLEAYKVGLIAQAEAAKAQSEVKKTIALRYSEIEFERLVALDLLLTQISSRVMAFGMVSVQHKQEEHSSRVFDELRAFDVAHSHAEMFLSTVDHSELLSFSKKLNDFVGEHVGSGMPSPPIDAPLLQEIRTLRISAHDKLIARIQGLGRLS